MEQSKTFVFGENEQKIKINRRCKWKSFNGSKEAIVALKVISDNKEEAQMFS